MNIDTPSTTTTTVPAAPAAPAPEAIVPVTRPAPAINPPAADPTFGGVVGTLEVLSEAEAAQFQVSEASIQKCWYGFVEAGLALALIRDKDLARMEYDSFDDYCLKKWGFHRSKVHAWITAAQLFTTFSARPDLPKPDHESQLRPLFGLTPEQAQLAWQCAAVKAGNRKITARLVKSVATELQLKVETRPAKRRINKSEQRKVVNASIGELLALVRQKVAYEILTAKLEGLHQHIQLLFAPSVPKR